MSGKYSHFTSKALVVLGVLLAQTALAQNPWAEGINIAGEAVGTKPGHEAEAAVGGDFTSGDFRSPSMGKTLWSANAMAAAVSSYDDLYLTGVFGFDLTHGYNMTGSMFTEPGFFPVDVLEFTPGEKVKQTYTVGGGLAWKNGSPWTPGITASFRGINYAKRKDLRHTTYRQDFQIEPSVHYNGGTFQAGFTGIFRKNSEFITAEQVGQATAESYMAFLDKGKRFGTYEVWDGSGTHINEPGVNRFPVKQYTWGGALQASLGELLYGDVEYTWSYGEVGEKGYIWFRFPGRELNAKLILTLRGDRMVHRVSAHYTWKSVENSETVMDKVTQGGVTTPRIYGSNLVFRDRELVGGLRYNLVHENGWSVSGGAVVDHSLELSTLMYPFYNQELAVHLTLNAGGAVRLGNFLLRGDLRFIRRVGARIHNLDVADTEIGVSSIPFCLLDWHERDDEAADTARTVLNAAVRYTFGNGIFIEAETYWIHAFKVVLISGNDRQTTGLKLGYNF